MILSAVLLAGGESRRMGCDKATMTFEGQPLWQRQLATLRQVEAEQIFVSARTDPPWRPNDVKFVADVGESHGPWSGIAAAVAQISTTHLLALAIDMPFMTARYLRSLCESARGIVPKIGDRYEPLAAIYPREVLVDLAQTPNRFGFSLQDLVKRLILDGKITAKRVAAEEEGLFRNLNDPADVVTR